MNIRGFFGGDGDWAPGAGAGASIDLNSNNISWDYRFGTTSQSIVKQDNDSGETLFYHFRPEFNCWQRDCSLYLNTGTLEAPILPPFKNMVAIGKLSDSKPGLRLYNTARMGQRYNICGTNVILPDPIKQHFYPEPCDCVACKTGCHPIQMPTLKKYESPSLPDAEQAFTSIAKYRTDMARLIKVRLCQMVDEDIKAHKKMTKLDMKTIKRRYKMKLNIDSKSADFDIFIRVITEVIELLMAKKYYIVPGYSIKVQDGRIFYDSALVVYYVKYSDEQLQYIRDKNKCYLCMETLKETDILGAIGCSTHLVHEPCAEELVDAGWKSVDYAKDLLGSHYARCGVCKVGQTYDEYKEAPKSFKIIRHLYMN